MVNSSKSLSDNNSKLAPVQRPMIDLFAGCGGLSLGFEKAGFTTVFVNELNDDARIIIQFVYKYGCKSCFFKTQRQPTTASK